MDQIPSIGRIVHFNDGGSEPLPMIINEVHSDDCVSGVSFPIMETPTARVIRAYYNPEPMIDHWSWPPRV